MPRSRNTSMARWFVMWARGVFAVHRYLVTMMLGIPRADRNSAAPAPAGPEPITTTSVVTATPEGSSVSAIPSLNTAMSSPFSAARHVVRIKRRTQCVTVDTRRYKPGDRTWRKSAAVAGIEESARLPRPGLLSDVGGPHSEAVPEGLREVGRRPEAASCRDLGDRCLGRLDQQRVGTVEPTRQDVLWHAGVGGPEGPRQVAFADAHPGRDPGSAQPHLGEVLVDEGVRLRQVDRARFDDA